MKKQLLSIIALILCFCTVFVFAACGKKDENESLNGSDKLNDESGESESLEGESGKASDSDGLKDVDAATAETIFSEMKTAYNATLNHKGAYSISTNINNEVSFTEPEGETSLTSKETSKATIIQTADPDSNKLSYTYSSTDQFGTEPATTTTTNTKIYSESGKNYLYVAEGDISAYQLLSSYSLAAQKEDMLIKSAFASDFARGFGDPFAASKAADLKTVTSAVLNEVKTTQKTNYESGMINGTTYEVDQCVATANIVFNKSNGANILKRTITTSLSCKYNGGVFKENITVESLLKTKDGKILSFEITSTRTNEDDLTSGGAYQESHISTITYDFTYSFNSTEYNKIATQTPSEVQSSGDYFEVPVSLVAKGSEITVIVSGTATAEKPVSAILEETVDMLFGDLGTTWYKDASCTTEFSFSSITSIDSLKNLKIYGKTFDIAANEAYAISSSKATANISANYKIVFGNISDENLNSLIDTMQTHYDIDTTETENNIKKIAQYNPIPGYSLKATLDGTELNPADATEESAGEFFWSMQLNGGSIYFIQYTYTITDGCFDFFSFCVE